MRTLCLLALLLAHPPAATAQEPARRDPPRTHVVHVKAGDDLQAAINSAKPGTTLALQPGAVFTQSPIVRKRTTDIVITSDGCALGERAALPTDLPGMATITAAPGQSFALWVMGAKVSVRCLSFGPNAKGHGEMVRIGDSTSADKDDTPDGDELVQNYFHGDPGNDFGQKRAIAANGSHLLIDRNYAEDIWAPGQDSQCVAVFSTPGPVTITRNVFACASENILIGGTPPAGPAFLPSDILVEDNVLWKPLKWKGATPARVVKNLFEVKFGHRIVVRHNWMENHWQQAQPGPAIVLTLATNGACGYCDMQDVTFENNVVWNVSAGLSLTGFQYSYAPGSGQAVRFVIRNNLFSISKAAMGGNGRPLVLSNEPKDVTVDHNTFIHDGTAVIAAEYGKKWPLQDPPLSAAVKAGPVQGFRFTNNLAQHGSYGVFTPDGNRGLGIETYFPGAVFGGNVLLGASSAMLKRYNALAGDAGPNVGGEATFSEDGCQSEPAAFPGKGADCSKLPFALRALIPAGQ
jgi:hypothetical protein